MLNINVYRQNGWKWKQKQFFKQYFLNILYVFSNKCQKLTNLKPYENQLETLSFIFVTIIGQNGRASGEKRDPPRSDYVKNEYSTKNITFDRSKKKDPVKPLDLIQL